MKCPHLDRQCSPAPRDTDSLTKTQHPNTRHEKPSFESEVRVVQELQAIAIAFGFPPEVKLSN